MSKSNNQCIFYFLLIKKFYQPLPFSKVRSEQISYIYFCVTSPYIKRHTIGQIVTVKIQYGGVRYEKYLANSFCDTLAGINLIYVSFVMIYYQETCKKNIVPDTEPFQ